MSDSIRTDRRWSAQMHWWGDGGQCYWVTGLQRDWVPHWIPEEGEETWGREQAVWPNTDWCSGENFSIVSSTRVSTGVSPVCHTPTRTADGYSRGSCIQTVACVSCVFLTCSTGLVCVFGKEVGLFSHRIRSLRDRHLLLGRDLPLSTSKSLTSSWPSSSRLSRRWWWSRYAALRDRKRANHLLRK